MGLAFTFPEEVRLYNPLQCGTFSKERGLPGGQGEVETRRHGRRRWEGGGSSWTGRDKLSKQTLAGLPSVWTDYLKNKQDSSLQRGRPVEGVGTQPSKFHASQVTESNQIKALEPPAPTLLPSLT